MNHQNEAARVGVTRLTALGVLSILLGMFAMLVPGLIGVSIGMILGALVVVAGMARLIWAFHSGGFGRMAWMLVVSGLTVFCGVALLAHPLFTSGVLTIVLSVYFISDGFCEIAAGLKRLEEAGGGGWLVLAGIVSILLGALIWAQYPLSGAWAMGTFIGIKLFFVGLTMITIASGISKRVL